MLTHKRVRSAAESAVTRLMSAGVGVRLTGQSACGNLHPSARASFRRQMSETRERQHLLDTFDASTYP